jgi:threonine efflux protein
MSHASTLVAISLADLLAIVSPGPAFLLVSRTAASHSRARGMATGFGVGAAITLWAAAAAFGVAAVMARFAMLYGLLQLAGGAYLIWLGLSAWHDTGRTPERPTGRIARNAAGSGERYPRAMLTGFLLTLGNPKVVVFFTSIFVTLLPAEAPWWARVAAIGVIAVQECTWYVLLAAVFAQARMQAGYARLRGGIDRAVGTALIAAGARIVALARP